MYYCLSGCPYSTALPKGGSAGKKTGAALNTALVSVGVNRIKSNHILTDLINEVKGITGISSQFFPALKISFTFVARAQPGAKRLNLCYD